MARINIRLPIIGKITLTILLSVTVVGVATVLFVSNKVGSSLSDSKKETIALANLEQSHETSQVVSFGRGAADLVPTLPGVSAYMENKNRIVQDKTILKTLTNFNIGRNFLSIYLLDASGLTVLSTDPTLTGNNFGFRDYFSQAITGQKFMEIAVGTITNQIGIYFSNPITDSLGKIIGVSVVKMDTQPVFQTMMASYITRLGKYMLVNSDGIIINTNKEDALFKSLGVLSSDVKSHIQTERRYVGIDISPLDYDVAQKTVETMSPKPVVYEFYDDLDKNDELIQVNEIGDFPLYLVSEVNTRSVDSVVSGIVGVVILFIIVSISLGVFVVILVLRKTLSPLAKLNKYAKSVTSGNYNEQIEIKSGDEMESLAGSIREMVVSLKGLSSGLEKTVEEKTKQLEETLSDVENNNIDLENTKRAVLNVMEDLSEEKDKMTIEKNRLETILASIGDGVFVVNRTGMILMTNGAAQRMSGLTEFESVGKYYSDVFKFRVEDDTNKIYPDFVKTVLKTGEVQSLRNHTVIVSKSGMVISVLDSAAPIRDVNGNVTGCVVVFRDNTKERELEKSKDDFMSVTSHQLRTPLGGMRWNLEMMLEGDVGELPAEAKRVAGEVYKGNLRMIQLVNDLLNVNRIDQGRVMDEPSMVQLPEVIQDAAKELSFEASAKKVDIKLTLGKVPNIFIDPKRFREVTMNLVSNAVKYNKPGGKVEVVLKSVDKQLVMSVVDNGVGIPKNDMPKMFGKFYRASNAVHSETEGSGLGLYVVKKFVEGWGGKIDLVSNEGKGTSITISLPLEKIKNN